MSENGHVTVLFRVKELERKVEDLEEKVNGHDVEFAEVKGEIKSILKEIQDVREDVLTVIVSHTDRTWKLIFALSAALVVLAGAGQALKFF